MAAKQSENELSAYDSECSETGAPVKINFATGWGLTAVHGIGPISSGKLVELRDRLGNITPKTLRETLGSRVSKRMLDGFDFERNPELETEFEIQSETYGDNYDADGEMPDPDLEYMFGAELRKTAAELMQTPMAQTQGSLNLPHMRADTVSSSKQPVVKSDANSRYKVGVSQIPVSLSTRGTDGQGSGKAPPRAPHSRYEGYTSGGRVETSSRDYLPDTKPIGHAPTQATNKPRYNREGSPTDSVTSTRRRSRKHRGKPILPKNLTYDGRGNFSAFKQKFESYADAYDWTNEDCKSCLCWSLLGKASDFYAIITERDPDIPYYTLMTRMEKRFGDKDLDETAQVKFHQAMQRQTEPVDDWADRILSLANGALWDLPEQHVGRQAVIRFCQGLFDQEAGHEVCIRRPRSLEDAVDHVKLYQNVHDMMRDRRPIKKDRAQATHTMDVLQTTRQPEPTSAVSDLTSKFDRLASEFARIQVLQQTAPRAPSNAQKQIPSLLRMQTPVGSQGGPPHPGSMQCFHCGTSGHFKRECPNIQCFQCQQLGHIKTRCPFTGLNAKGSWAEAKPRPQ